MLAATLGVFDERSVSQIIAFAGDGKLRDGSDCSGEFREFLAETRPEQLKRYADDCLASSFDSSGEALQDIVNEMGRRIGFEVTNGKYRGAAGQIGNDGLWRTPSGHALVVESKTTDVYQINLDTVAGYRRALIAAQEIASEQSSILMVVGRQATDGLEAQVRGSKHAWDVRLISVDALSRLMLLKGSVEDPALLEKARQVLIPREFTKVDAIVDLLFSTAEEFLVEDASDVDDSNDGTASAGPVKFNDACAERIATNLKVPLLKRSRVTFASADGSTVVICAVSRERIQGGNPLYWYAFHPHQQESVVKAASGYVAFGCGSPETILLVPAGEFLAWLPDLWKTEKEDRFYWHVKISKDGPRLLLQRRAGKGPLDVTQYLLP